MMKGIRFDEICPHLVQLGGNMLLLNILSSQ